jgi:hypothetical protein
MISRLTAFAAIFAVVTTASLAYATNVAQHRGAAVKAKTEIVMLERVVITGHRTVSSN